MSVNPISYQEIQAFNLIYKLNLEDWEIDTIITLDRIALNAYHKQQKQEADNNK